MQQLGRGCWRGSEWTSGLQLMDQRSALLCSVTHALVAWGDDSWFRQLSFSPLICSPPCLPIVPAPACRGASLLAPMLSLEKVSRKGINPYIRPIANLLSWLAPTAAIVATEKNVLYPDIQVGGQGWIDVGG